MQLVIALALALALSLSLSLALTLRRIEVGRTRAMRYEAAIARSAGSDFFHWLVVDPARQE